MIYLHQLFFFSVMTNNLMPASEYFSEHFNWGNVPMQLKDMTSTKTLNFSQILEEAIFHKSLASTNQVESNLPNISQFDSIKCVNSTLLDQFVKEVVKNVTTLSSQQRRDMEGDPLLYIVAVLLFYSCGIVILMINYMKKVLKFYLIS